jgi:hypothetical protein
MSHFDHAVRMEEMRRSEKEGRLIRLPINWVPLDYKASKYERWQKLHPRFTSRSIIFADSIPPSIKEEIKDELVRGEAARFKDFLDALALAETGFRPRIAQDGKPVEIARPAHPNVLTFESALGATVRRLERG